MRAGVVGLVAVAFSNEVGTITTLSKCSSKLAMLTGNGQRTLAVRCKVVPTKQALWL